MAFDALAELKKYRTIDLENVGPWREDPVPSLLLAKMTDDINRIAKSLFRLEQQFENHAEEILARCNQEFEKDARLRELHALAAEYGAKKEQLVQALMGMADALDTVAGFIEASGDSAWIAQMQQICRPPKVSWRRTACWR